MSSADRRKRLNDSSEKASVAGSCRPAVERLGKDLRRAFRSGARRELGFRVAAVYDGAMLEPLDCVLQVPVKKV